MSRKRKSPPPAPPVVELIPADPLERNPLNPYDLLPPAERRARFVALLVSINLEAQKLPDLPEADKAA